jgi:anti-anti-sigma factor
MEFEISEQVRDAVRVVSVRGEFDLDHASQAREVLGRAAADLERALVIDLIECTFLDSTAIAVIVGASRPLQNGQAKVAIASTPDSDPWEILALAGVDQSVVVASSVETAMAAALAED